VILPTEKGMPLTRVFAIAGLDRRAIGSKLSRPEIG